MHKQHCHQHWYGEQCGTEPLRPHAPQDGLLKTLLNGWHALLQALEADNACGTDLRNVPWQLMRSFADPIIAHDLTVEDDADCRHPTLDGMEVQSSSKA